MTAGCSFATANGTCRRKARTGLCWQHTPLNICCGICIENVGRCKKFALSCSHVFHRQCIAKWARKGGDTCPYCRHPLSGYETCVLGRKRCGDVEVSLDDIERIVALFEIILE
jgi:hypothetical protein